MQLSADADGFVDKRADVPEFVQPLLKEKTEVIRREETSEQEKSEESDSDAEIATPLAVKKEVPLSREDQIASSNRPSLSRGLNTNCIKYYTKPL